MPMRFYKQHNIFAIFDVDDWRTFYMCERSDLRFTGFTTHEIMPLHQCSFNRCSSRTTFDAHLLAGTTFFSAVGSDD